MSAENQPSYKGPIQGGSGLGEQAFPRPEDHSIPSKEQNQPDQKEKGSITRRGLIVGTAATAAGALIAESRFSTISNVINRLSGNNSSPENSDQKAVSGFDPDDGGSIARQTPTQEQVTIDPTNTPEQQVVDPTSTPSPTPTEARPSSTPTEYDNTATPSEDFEPTPTHPKPPETTATQETEAWDRTIDISVSADPESAPELAAINLIPNPIYSRVNQYGETIDGQQTLQEFGWRVLARLAKVSEERSTGGTDIKELNSIDYKAFAQNIREQEGYTFQVLGHPTTNPDTGKKTDLQTGKDYWKRNHEPELIDVDPSKGIGFHVLVDGEIANLGGEGHYKGSFVVHLGMEGRMVVDDEKRLTIYTIIDPKHNNEEAREKYGLFSVSLYGPINYQAAALNTSESATHDKITKGEDINGVIGAASKDTLGRDMTIMEVDPSTPADNIHVLDDDGVKVVPLQVAG